MHWIVNTCLKREGGYYALVEQLERQGHPYTLVRKPPFADYLVAMEDDFDDGHQKPIMLDHIEEAVFVTGTTSMKAVSEAHGWTPGYIDAPSQAECFAMWGDHMLNIDARFGTIAEIAAPTGRDFFIRPDKDSKAFSGTIMREQEFEGWRRDLMSIDTWTTVSPSTEVMIAPLKKIWAEYRCIMVEGRYVTGSRYKTGQTVGYSEDVGDRIRDFANRRVAEWCPRIAMCLDIADTPDGLKIIETNAISSAGFYAIDMGRFVGAISALA